MLISSEQRGLRSHLRLQRGGSLAASRPMLPVAVDDQHQDLIVSAQSGAPIWPLDPSFVEPLRSAVALFGGAITHVAPNPISPRASIGRVIGLGDVGQLANLYAHLTARSCSIVKSASELAPTDAPDIVITMASRLDSSLVQFLMLDTPPGSVTGIVWGRTHAELLQQVLVTAAAATINGPIAADRTDFVYYAEGARLKEQRREQLGARASGKQVARALSRGSGLLTVFQHGDATGFRLTEKTAVCGCYAPPIDADPTRGPACIETGLCHKLHVSRSRAFAARRLVLPEIIAARVLLLLTCQGAFVGSNVLDSAWSPLPRLVASSRIGAVLATPMLSNASVANVSEHLCAPLSSGMRLGDALASYERSAEALGIGHRLLLFGDPKTRAIPGVAPTSTDAGTTPSRPPSKARRIRRKKPATRDIAKVEMLTVMAQYVRESLGTEAARTALRAQEAIERYHHMQLLGKRPNPFEMHEALLDHFTTMRGNPEEAWMLLQPNVTRLTESRPCPRCDWPIRPLVASFASGLSRTTIDCPCCTMVSDQPTGAVRDIRLDLPDVFIEGSLPTKEWSAAAYVVPARSRNTKCYRWPASRSGAPVRHVRLRPARWPPGPFGIRVILLKGTGFYAYGALARAPNDASVRGCR